MAGGDDNDKPRDRARRRLLRMGAYAPAALVSLSAVSKSAERAEPTTSIDVLVDVTASTMATPLSGSKAKAS